MSFSVWSSVCVVGVFLAVAGCVPVPTSTVPLHQREARPVVAQSEPAANHGVFASVAFDGGGKVVAAYDSGDDSVQIFRAHDLAEIERSKPARRPRRLSFSPSGRFLVIEAQPGWIEDHLDRTASGYESGSSHVAIDSPEAIRDAVQRVEIWDRSSGRTVSDLACDDAVTSEPRGGWLWARKWAIAPGYRSAPIVEARFSADETELSILCWNGTRQRWDVRTWERRENLPAPAFWNELMKPMAAGWMAEDGVSCRSGDGRFIALRVREEGSGSGTAWVWDDESDEVRRLTGECSVHLLPVSGLSHDGERLVTVCGKGLGHSIHAWDLGAGRELRLADADFDLGRGDAEIRSGGVALSPDGRYLAAALLAQMEALVVTPVPGVWGSLARSDLRIWEVDRGRALVSVPIDDLVRRADYFHGVDLAFSPDGSLLAAGGGQIRIYRVSDLAAD